MLNNGDLKEKEKNQKKEKKAKILIKVRRFMSKIVLKRIKKPGGGTREQKVEIDSKGRWKFVKNTTKGMVRKTRAKGRLAYEKVKKKTKRKSSKPKSKSNKPRRKSNSMKLPKMPSFLKKVAIGLGAATLASMAVGIFAPQYVPIARPIAAYLGGGVPGVAGELIIDQGLLGNITSMFGGGGGINETRLAGGL
jgi:hypothetical protein